jgi:negative regulator of flagellin synthesis FlgM
MDISRINQINQVKQTLKPKKGSEKGKAGQAADKVSISSQAKEMAQLQKTLKAVNESSDIRQDRVAAVKQKLANGEYDGELSEAVVSRIADKIVESIGL